MGLVTTVFRVYYRVREFLAGAWRRRLPTPSAASGPSWRPAVRSLMEAFGSLIQAIFPVFKALGLVRHGCRWLYFSRLGWAPSEPCWG